MDQAGGPDTGGSRVYVPGYTLDRGMSVDRTGALVDAHDNATGSRVVIRLLSPALSSDAAYRRQVRHDMGILCVLRHQHLLSVIAFDDRHAAIVYEWVDGITVRHLIDVSGRLSATAALVVFDDTLAALEALHAAGIVHRDVTPSAVLLDTDGTGILRDAGIPAPPLRRGWRSGTPQYMAPELWAGRPHTVATDIYAATGVLVETLTGRPPYLGTDLSGLGVQHTQGALPSEAVPLLARELVIRGLAKDPRDRPASAASFRRDVETAGSAFLGASWRDQGRAWLAVVVADRLTDPAPAAADVEIVDDDEDTPLRGLALDSAADGSTARRRGMEGLVGGRGSRGRPGGDDHLRRPGARRPRGSGVADATACTAHRPDGYAESPGRGWCAHEHRHRRRSDRDPDATTDGHADSHSTTEHDADHHRADAGSATDPDCRFTVSQPELDLSRTDPRLSATA